MYKGQHFQDVMVTCTDSALMTSLNITILTIHYTHLVEQFHCMAIILSRYTHVEAT